MFCTSLVSYDSVNSVIFPTTVYVSSSISVSKVSTFSLLFWLSILLSDCGFVSDIFCQVRILLSIFHVFLFLLFDLFHQIICYQSYLSDFSHNILCQYCQYFSEKSIYQFQKFYITGQYFCIIFTHIISFIRFIFITHIYPIYFIRLFVIIMYISLGTQFYQFQNFYIISQYISSFSPI